MSKSNMAEPFDTNPHLKSLNGGMGIETNSKTRVWEYIDKFFWDVPEAFECVPIIQVNIQQVKMQALEEGIEQGRVVGIIEGREEGIEQGRVAGIKEYMELRRDVPFLEERPNRYLKKWYYATQPLGEPENP